MTRTGDNQGGAIMQSDGPTGIVIYFDTDDIDASIAKVREHGGTSDEKHPIPGIGWFTHCKDTEGNDFSLFQSDESVTA
jgi:predicted enzyme related to lactoylglutathione lyase